MFTSSSFSARCSAGLSFSSGFRSSHLKKENAESDDRVLRTIRGIAKIGLILFPAAFLANFFGYVNLGIFWESFFSGAVYGGRALHRHSDHRRIDYCWPAGATTWLVASLTTASADASAEDLPWAGVVGFFVLVECDPADFFGFEDR